MYLEGANVESNLMELFYHLDVKMIDPSAKLCLFSVSLLSLASKKSESQETKKTDKLIYI